jgi:hypothetical protein
MQPGFDAICDHRGCDKEWAMFSIMALEFTVDQGLQKFEFVA